MGAIKDIILIRLV